MKYDVIVIGGGMAGYTKLGEEWQDIRLPFAA